MGIPLVVGTLTALFGLAMLASTRFTDAVFRRTYRQSAFWRRGAVRVNPVDVAENRQGVQLVRLVIGVMAVVIGAVGVITAVAVR